MNPHPNPYGRAILFALQSKPIYTGTVSKATTAKLRAAGKVAKASRKQNRGR